MVIYNKIIIIKTIRLKVFKIHFQGNSDYKMTKNNKVLKITMKTNQFQFWEKFLTLEK